MALPVSRRRFTVDEYERMADAGILAEDDRVELVGGEIVEMAPIGPAHAGCVKRLLRLFTALLGDRAMVSVQDPVRLGVDSEPQPDIALLRPRSDFYSTRHPEPADVLLVVEVAMASASYDRLVKLPLYASAGLPQAWLVDLESRSLEIYRLADDRGAYGKPEVVRGTARAPIDAFPDAALSVSDILG